MIVIGVNPMDDASACLVKDGRLVNYVERERFPPRWKHSRKYDPLEDRVKRLSPVPAIKWCLEDAGIKIYEVDFIVISWLAKKDVMKRLYEAVPYEKEPSRIRWEKRCLEEHAPEALMARLKIDLEEAGLVPVPPMVCIPHHLAHAATAYTSGWKTCAILTVDGHGDTTAIAGWIKREDEIKRIYWKPFWCSLGWFYAAVTEFLGMRMKNDETKVMNLANYANPSPSLERKMLKIVQIKEDDVEVDASYLLYGPHRDSTNPRYSDKWLKLFGEPYKDFQRKFRTREDVKGTRAATFAATAQKVLEEALLTLVNLLYKKTGVDHLVMAGGVALNCRANSTILKRTPFKDIFVCPPAHDGGTAIGAALYWYSHETGKDPTFCLKHAFYGPCYSNKEIERTLEEAELDFVKVDPVAKAVELLHENEIVAWFQGRCEMGPRALMNRSLLFDPTDKRNFLLISQYKSSVLWRDRSPSVTRSFAEEHFDPYFSRLDHFMLGLREVKENVIPAVTSIRGECRPQITDHPILKLLEEEGSLGAVGNTSLNRAGAPIVNSPKQCLEDCRKMGVKHLIIGDFYVRFDNNKN